MSHPASLWHQEAEQAVLGAMLLGENAPLRAIQVLGPEDFYCERHRVLFRLLQSLSERGIRVATSPFGTSWYGEMNWMP
jgi:replicative DNA helicase